jgi:large subunit ribosomal protein L4
MELQVKNSQGQVVGSIAVSDAVFAVPMNEAVVHQVMVAHLANRRQGTHSTRTRGEVSGGGRKPWAQKGTGRARQGSTRAPQWVHGGIVFGPRPRDYHQRIPKRMRRLAIRCLLSGKVQQGAITVLDQLALSAPKTKELLGLLTSLGIGEKCLVVTAGPDRNVALAVRNLERVKGLPAATINVLDLLNYDHLLMSVDAVKNVEELWAQERHGHRAVAPAAT